MRSKKVNHSTRVNNHSRGDLLKPDRLRSKNLIAELYSHSESQRREAMKALAEKSASAPRKTRERLLKLFEHLAKFSDYADIRRASVTVLFFQAPDRLRNLVFETGDSDIRTYRNEMLSHLVGTQLTFAFEKEKITP